MQYNEFVLFRSYAYLFFGYYFQINAVHKLTSLYHAVMQRISNISLNIAKPMSEQSPNNWIN